MKKIAITICLVTLAGCSAPVRNYAPAITETSDPAIGVTTTARIGDYMVNQGLFVEHDALYVEKEVGVGLIGSPYKITKGYYLKIGEKKDKVFFDIENHFPEGGRIIKAALADPPKAVSAARSKVQLCGISVFNGSVCTDEAAYRFAKKAVASPTSFQQTLIYNGKVGNKINVAYREFSGDVARPAFSNSVEYDLGQSTSIGYKGAQIDVLEATNEQITYIVRRNFNTAR